MPPSAMFCFISLHVYWNGVIKIIGRKFLRAQGSVNQAEKNEKQIFHSIKIRNKCIATLPQTNDAACNSIPH
jgi:hypothetical protein